MQNHKENINYATGNPRAEKYGIQNWVLSIRAGWGFGQWPGLQREKETTGVEKSVPEDWTEDKVRSLEAGEEHTSCLNDQQVLEGG